MARPAAQGLAPVLLGAPRAPSVAGSTTRPGPQGRGAVAPQSRLDRLPTRGGTGSRSDAPGFPQVPPHAAPQEGRPVSPRCRAARSLLAVTPALAGTLRRIAHVPTRPAFHPGPARGARTRPACSTTWGRPPGAGSPSMSGSTVGTR